MGVGNLRRSLPGEFHAIGDSGGSHRIFSRDGIVEILNLQPRDGRRAKAYQVKQVRQLILTYALAGETPDDDAS